MKNWDPYKGAMVQKITMASIYLILRLLYILKIIKYIRSNINQNYIPSLTNRSVGMHDMGFYGISILSPNGDMVPSVKANDH